MAESPLLRSVGLSLAILSLLVAPISAQVPPPDPRFGAVDAFRDPVAAAEAGVGWERILLYWSHVQPSGPGEWNEFHLSERDGWLAQAESAGREIVGLLIDTPAWATEGLPKCGVPRGLELPVDDPGNVWATFVRQIVQRYSGRIRHWIIWNEPDIARDSFGVQWCGSVDEYYQLLKVAYLAARQADPNVTIHLAALTFHHDSAYLDRFLDVATKDPSGPEHNHYFDVVTLHIYFQTETVPAIVDNARASLTAYGMSKPIWINETNAPSNADPPYWVLPEANFDVTLQDQAAFLLQSFALGLSRGVERIAVYRWVDNEPRPGEEPFGVIRSDYSRRPAYDAYRLITTHYAGTTAAREERQLLYTVVTLDRGSHTTRVLWASTQAGATVSLPAVASQAQLITQTGTEQVIEPALGRYTLDLPGARCPPVSPESAIPHPPCIIGGPTFLLIEETESTPTPTETPTPIELPTIISPPATPTAPPTATSTPTPVPSPSETPAPPPPPLSPISTPTPLPPPAATSSPVPTAFPTSTPSPTVPPTPPPPAWPMLVGLAVVMLFAAIVGTMFKNQA
jgi:hypothetical protein